ncbi:MULTISPECIES: molybdopterin oxidoreductase family protein [unclassified Streptomyces]|uniref:molybdopterin oxidoreductase family protein n=1 Tax=unclassified Streptomyces TaxID=2593676 RepID=UPI001BE4EAD3|nr:MULTISPECIES: molybdopterin oxidoreductase family protein [unclassified Streptomyces]MBT2379707.1 molybdopterin oxidoreductase family protein [Streptomyces sp. ISL-111]MBT2426339.1 molybdopterin oxidoreductase family protein [Streptomyces sp. ISL-112]MBT2465298.1 molybdopterin oxidoreductase family protein [Streptomyces sp. ISL-63]
MKTALRTCPLCETSCGLRLTLDDGGSVLRVEGDQDDPFSKGFLCPKGAALGQLDEDPDRLAGPLVRVDGQLRPASWEEAFAEVHRGLGEIMAAHGRDAVALYFGNPTFHTMAGFLYRQPLTQALGSRNVYSASTIDQMPKHVSSGLMFGDPMAVAVPDLDRTDYMLILGANPVESNGSLCVAPDFKGRLRALQERGGKVVVVDPRRTRTAELADEHLFIRPGTDAYLLFGIVHTLLAEELTSLDMEVTGLTELMSLASDFTPQVVERACGVPAATTVRLAREVAAAPSASVYARIGTCTAEFGSTAQWLVDVINVLTGNLDRAGGVMFAKTAGLEIFRSGQPFATGAWRSRVRGLPEVLGEFPVATMADEIETPGDGQIRALVTVGGNPALSAPGAPRLARALSGLDFMVCVDPYVNETTRHANVILPPPRILQSPHFDFLVQIIMVRNYARFSPPVLPLGEEQRSETAILAKLLLILSGQGPDLGPEVCEEVLLGQLLAAAPELRDGLEGADGTERILDALLKLGGYGLSLEAMRQAPHGLDLGPLQPRLPEILCTASGKVDLVPGPLAADVPRLLGRLRDPAPEMVLIGRRHLRSNNSWMHNVPSLVGGSNRCTLQIHPRDVARFGLGERARVQSAAGEVEVSVEATETIMPGVVSLPHGWGHKDTGQSVARRNAGVNANALTDELVMDPVSGNAVFNGVPVRVLPV